MPTEPRPTVRVAIILSHPTQYYSPWFRWMQAHTDLKFRVFYLWDFGIKPTHDPQFQKAFAWDVDLVSGYDWEMVPNTARDPGTHHFWGLRNPDLLARLAAWRPDAVLLFGYNWASHLRAAWWARRHGVPLIFRGDSHLLGRGRQPWLRAWLLRWLFRQFAAVTYVGGANREYFRALAVPDQRLFFAPHSVNADFFDPAAEGRKGSAAALRAQLGISPETKVILFAGKLVAAKGPQTLLDAFVGLGAIPAELVFVGDGPEKAALQAAAAASPRAAAIHFLPFANQSEMPVRYLAADLFVLPSIGFYETWGLAVNEAMHLGVPCVVSDRVGSQQDLVIPGQTGWVFPAGDKVQLQMRLGQALATLSDSQATAQLRRAISEKISGYTYAATTQGLREALARIAMRLPSPR